MDKNLTKTLEEQTKTEKMIQKIFDKFGFNTKLSEKYSDEIELMKEEHYYFAYKLLYKLPYYYSALDAGMPWFAYWVYNILNIYQESNLELNYATKLKFVQFLKELQHENGGFCGYSRGMPQVISNYAAVMAIVALGIEEGYDLINKEKMKNYLLSMKNNKKNSENFVVDSKNNYCIEKVNGSCCQSTVNWPGSFQVHENGESDLRATYCALSVAYVLNILDEELSEGVVENIKLCQTFEGGLGPEPFCEAHGGYSFCGIAALIFLNQLHAIDINSFIKWLANRQMTIEGGFQGRTNKLVDSCYSFWQASIFNMIALDKPSLYTYDCELLYDQKALQAYILLACQANHGGLIDKPGKKADLFHTNYASCGLSSSQYSTLKDFSILFTEDVAIELERINPLFGVLNQKVDKAIEYYKNH